MTAPSGTSVDLGGKPKPGTTPDKRLKENPGGKNKPPKKMMASEPQWQGCLVPEGIATGDGREFAVDSLSWVDPPMPLRWQKEGSHGGNNDVTVQVGLITRVWRDGNRVMGEGHFDLGGPETDDAHEAFRRMNAGTCTGVSIDADDITNADIEYVFPESDGSEVEEDDVLFMLFQQPEKVIFHSARIRAATLCDIPAFIDANLHLLTPDELQSLSASAALIDTYGVVSPHDAPTSDAPWDASTHEARLPSPMPEATASGSYAHIDHTQMSDGMMPRGGGSFLHHEINADGTPGAANLTAASSGIGALQSGRAGTTIPASDHQGVYDHLAKHLRDAGQEPPPFQAQEAIVAHAWHDEWRPPSAWFADPKLGQVVPITITEQGRVYGHAAQWGQCHLGYMGECVMPPFEDYHSYYRTGEVICDDGTHVATGTITAGIEHAKLTMGPAAAKEHYENSDAQVAYVIVGNDAHGIWVAGAIRPEAHASRVQTLRGSGQVSPDWRRIGGALRMVGLLTVNVSGYQTQNSPRARSLVASGEVQALQVEGMIAVRQPSPSADDLNVLALKMLRDQLAARVHPEGE